jgi:hypothetical protein
MNRRWKVTTDNWDLWRDFRSFRTAERYARKLVAASTAERFPITADIVGPDTATSAVVRADALGRVWTDIGAISPRVRAAA